MQKKPVADCPTRSLFLNDQFNLSDRTCGSGPASPEDGGVTFGIMVPKDCKEQKTSLARRSLVVQRFSLILLFLLTSVVVAFGQDCDPLKPNKPLDSEISNDTKLHASALFKSLGTAEFDNKFAQAQQDTLSKYPNADKVAIAQSHLYFLCTLLKSSTTLSENQKLDRFMDLVKIQDGVASPPK